MLGHVSYIFANLRSYSTVSFLFIAELLHNIIYVYGI